MIISHWLPGSKAMVLFPFPNLSLIVLSYSSILAGIGVGKCGGTVNHLPDRRGKIVNHLLVCSNIPGRFNWGYGNACVHHL